LPVGAHLAPGVSLTWGRPGRR